MTIMEMASSSYSQYVWKEFFQNAMMMCRVIIPSSLLYSTNNVMIISVHYDEYDEYQQLMTYSVLGVYASIPDTRLLKLLFLISRMFTSSRPSLSLKWCEGRLECGSYF